MPRLVFISHSHVDRAVARDVKALLNAFGTEAFVAHEDIELSEEWLEQITATLRRCDGMIYLVSEASSASDWTDQEVGFALCRDIPVIPMSLGKKPWGFVGRYQSKSWISVDLPAEYDRIKPNAVALGNALLRKRLLTVDDLIETFGASRGFVEAILTGSVLAGLDNLTGLQARRIAEHAARNDQIYKCAPIRRWLPRLVEEQGSAIPNPLFWTLRRMGIKLRVTSIRRSRAPGDPGEEH